LETRYLNIIKILNNHIHLEDSNSAAFENYYLTLGRNGSLSKGVYPGF
jgi:hypothetical protein